MNDNWQQKHPAQQPSAINKYLLLAKQTRCPLSIHFTDGGIFASVLISEFDSLNLLVKEIDLDNNCQLGAEYVITRANIKMIAPAISKKAVRP